MTPPLARFFARPARWAAGGLLGLGAAGCTGPLARPAYLAYLADPAHGLTQARDAGTTTATCSYRPTDLLVAQELADRADITPAARDSARRAYAGKVYCTLALARNGAEMETGVINDETALGQALSYLSTGIARDVYLRGAGRPDSVQALGASYARQYGGTGRSTVLLVFAAPGPDVARGFTLTYRDTQFGLAPLHFAFTARALRDVPALQF